VAKPERLLLERIVAKHLDARDFEAASCAVAAYEAEQPNPRGMGIDWSNHPPERDVAILQTIYGPTPGILQGVRPESLGTLRRAAGLQYLLGTGRVRRMWLPRDLDTGIRLNGDAAARMLVFAGLGALHLLQLQQLPRTAVPGFRVSVCPDACTACLALARQRFDRSNLPPELPYSQCTSANGCRCGIAADLATPYRDA
jgi:hypothetical protein